MWDNIKNIWKRFTQVFCTHKKKKKKKQYKSIDGRKWINE